MTRNADTNEHLDLISTVGEWVAMLAGSTDVGSFLDRTASLVARHLQADICSIYLYDESSDELVLRATVGLASTAVGRVRMHPGEGLVGIALKKLRPIRVDNASRHPAFRYFPEAGEEGFDAFLAAPIRRGVEKVGVLVVQRAAERPFSEQDVMAMRAVGSQLAGAIEMARVMLDMNRQLPEEEVQASPSRVKGQAASARSAAGPSAVLRHRPELSALAEDPHSLSRTGTREDLDRALKATAGQLEDLQAQMGTRIPELASLIFDAHLMMLKDDSFSGEMRRGVGEGKPAGQAVLETACHFMDIFDASPHDYTREKAKDVEDLARRILSNLAAGEGDLHGGLADRVLIARDLLPSDMLKAAVEGVAAIVLVGGGTTSHVAILARSLRIPTVIVDSPALLSIPDGTPVLVDADTGNVLIRPGAGVVEGYEQKERVHRTVEAMGDAMEPETTSKDGVRVSLMANINLLSELELANALKAEGVGLYRTEFPFLIRDAFPGERDQESIYRRLFERMAGREVTVRTVDLGGDKVLSYFDMAGEANPALGLRSIRLALRHPDILDRQLSAILSAADGVPNVRVMFPMIGSLDDFRRGRDRILACHEELRGSRGISADLPAVGAMIEVPALGEVIDELAEEADFFSIGTNDFVQYMLAVDRTNERVAGYYCPHHPAVLRALARIVRRSQDRGAGVSVCGEMAHDPRYVPFFLGIGIRKLSVDPSFLPRVQQTVRAWSVSDAEAYADGLLEQGTVEGVAKRLRGSA